ncbi:unnamed protein product [Vitrella brassicaformis CCMP3155]|uniref:Gamma-glutamylcyclotransferase family protein n=2 Tax=Vitrella brassicaformis TaxID=1169539 RepID=A0A0G4EUQ1_VITBC|nr:unnamed protein product [Vitrella brassicaformis CCMP3155]|mmetsp:Transcript_23489/g.58025  ORF Transcript_23489/g.58025 Transcript_23489/m.58025 type:complete len:267 (+) Transcript_23489:167-967(+)|eukprot:CEM02179.1 unnamed protein product [Vitrella brassicaformis CCMP3155]
MPADLSSAVEAVEGCEPSSRPRGCSFSSAVNGTQATVRYEYVFVYGTLKRGFRNHYNMERDGIEYVAECATAHQLPLYLDHTNRYRPCLANVKGMGHQVCGELYRVHRRLIPELDDFERVPTHYHRECLPVTTEEGEHLHAHVYFNNTDRAREEELRRGHFELIPDYTYYHHKKYIPRAGNTRALELGPPDAEHLVASAPDSPAPSRSPSPAPRIIRPLDEDVRHRSFALRKATVAAVAYRRPRVLSEELESARRTLANSQLEMAA